MTLTKKDLREIEIEEAKMLNSGHFRFIVRHKKIRTLVVVTKNYDEYSNLLKNDFEHVYQSDKYSFIDVMKDIIDLETILYGDDDLVQDVIQLAGKL